MKDELNLIEPAQKYSDEDRARELMESLLWPNLNGVSFKDALTRFA